MRFATMYSWATDLHRALKRFDLRKRHQRDAVVIGSAAAAFCVTALTTDVMAYFTALHAYHWLIDITVLPAIVIAVACAVYAIRRIGDVNNEAAQRREAQAQAHSFVRHDPLTGLPNRSFFSQQLQAFLYQIPPGKRTTVMIFEVLGLRMIKDVHGQYNGDMALIEVAEGLSPIMEPDMLFARMGGDNFAIVQPAVDDIDTSARFARVVAAAIGRATFFGNTAGTLGACVGVAVAPDDGIDADALIRRADLALVRAMQAGRSNICFYKAEMDAHVERRGEVERALRLELPLNIIKPHYQPLVSFPEGHIIGFEALARWNSPALGPVPPDVFISVAEECGLIQELGDKLLRQACRDAATWPNDLTLAFNISPRQLKDPALVLRILSVLDETGLDPRRLEIEITESAFVGDISLARKIIEDLRAVGVRIALDDFGTGYATLSQLISLHFDKIKIDRSFIQRLGQDAESSIIVKAVIGLASGLGLTSLAEGIETANQQGDLRAAGCMQGQGYLFGKAMPADEVTRLLAAPTGNSVAA
jgi:diguanylate cyclase (GGDEF)-like protein